MDVASLVVMYNSGNTLMCPEYQVLLGIDGNFPSVEMRPGEAGAACLMRGVPAELREVSQDIYKRLPCAYKVENSGDLVRMEVYVSRTSATDTFGDRNYRWISLCKGNLQALKDGTIQIGEGISMPRSTFKILDDLADVYQ